MPKNYYLPTDDTGKADLLEHLAGRLPTYADQLSISADELVRLKADAAAFRYALTISGQAQYSAKNWVAFKNLIRDGGSGEGGGVFPPTSLTGGQAPDPVAPGVIPRLTAFVSRLKTAPKYTEAIGQDLGLVGSSRIVDSSSWQPVLTIHKEGGHPVLGWSKGDADGLEIWVERTPQAGFTFLTIRSDTRYLDEEVLPATPGTWRYKAIYRFKDEHSGEWSNVVSEVVGR